MRSRLGKGPREGASADGTRRMAGWPRDLEISPLDSVVRVGVGTKTRKAGESRPVTGLGSPTGEESMDLGPLAQEGVGSDCLPDWRQGNC